MTDVSRVVYACSCVYICAYTMPLTHYNINYCIIVLYIIIAFGE